MRQGFSACASAATALPDSKICRGSAWRASYRLPSGSSASRRTQSADSRSLGAGAPLPSRASSCWMGDPSQVGAAVNVEDAEQAAALRTSGDLGCLRAGEEKARGAFWFARHRDMMSNASGVLPGQAPLQFVSSLHNSKMNGGSSSKGDGSAHPTSLHRSKATKVRSPTFSYGGRFVSSSVAAHEKSAAFRENWTTALAALLEDVIRSANTEVLELRGRRQSSRETSGLLESRNANPGSYSNGAGLLPIKQQLAESLAIEAVNRNLREHQESHVAHQTQEDHNFKAPHDLELIEHHEQRTQRVPQCANEDGQPHERRLIWVQLLDAQPPVAPSDAEDPDEGEEECGQDVENGLAAKKELRLLVENVAVRWLQRPGRLSPFLRLFHEELAIQGIHEAIQNHGGAHERHGSVQGLQRSRVCRVHAK
eukprot:scaffold7760_cov286-Pinguiococcus_pyrenoidosus.AAC.1